MAGIPKASPIEAFELNMGDAQWLLETATALSDKRIRRMRAELRGKIGDALHLSTRDRRHLDRIESDDLFIVIKPGSSVGRDHVKNLAPLYRQSIVVAAAAVETYITDAVCRRIGSVFRDGSPLPKRLSEMTITIHEWNEIENGYQRRRRGLLEVSLLDRIAEYSSPHPDQIGRLLSMIRIDNWERQVDAQRQVGRGTTHKQLEALATRRNAIAHSGDRRGRGRALIDITIAQAHLDNATSIVKALDGILGPVSTEVQ